VVFLLGVGYFMMISNDPDEVEGDIDSENIEGSQFIEDGLGEEEDFIDSDEVSQDAEVSSQTSGQYAKYNTSKVASAEGDVVLFFKASWCPTCRALDADIKDSLSDIPADLIILEADYDEETTLKQKYGVTLQHTLVQVDSEGEMISKWSGSPNLEALVAKIK